LSALIDTHTLLWSAFTPDKLSLTVRNLVGDDSHRLFVSVVSAYEIANKVRQGKLPQAELLAKNFVESVTSAGFEVLPLEAEVALLAGRLPGVHRDPWDRMIAAQALTLDIPVISIDSKLDTFGVRRIW
jgi:PIN domain nuclease of toxin-antitoxin system